MFERAFVISLANRPERRKSFFSKLRQADWFPDVEVWQAVHGDTCQPPDNWHAGNGAWGCMRSHLAILEYCLNNRVASYLVFEDDAQFLETFPREGGKFYRSLPEGWQQVYFGGQLMHAETQPPIRVNDYCLRPYNVNRTHCFGVSRDGMLPLYKHISHLPYERHFHIDHHLGRWHEDARNAVYCPNRWQIGQHGFSSSVSGKTEEPTFFRDPIEYCKDHWLYDEPICFVWQAGPSLLRDADPWLHFGNTISVNGYDVSLEEATRLRRPSRAINGWYQWVRTECVQEGHSRVPCAYHPELTIEEFQQALPGIKVIPISGVRCPDDIRVMVEGEVKGERAG